MISATMICAMRRPMNHLGVGMSVSPFLTDSIAATYYVQLDEPSVRTVRTVIQGRLASLLF